jgi:DUF4097 and DUF4098 domain-containing protein YvlB
MTTVRFAVLTLGCVGIVFGAEAPITREGTYWMQVLSGSESLPPSAGLHITSRGAVTLAGHAQNQVFYALKVRVKARSEMEARRLMKSFGVRYAHRGGNGFAYLIVSRGNGMADLQVKCPRAIPEVVINTSEGGVEFHDLDGAVRAETGGGNIKADRIGGKVVARTAGGDITLGTIEGSARCATAGGKIVANVIRGDATFETGGGDIFAQEVGGLARASTMAGSVRIRRAGSAVIASTGGGPIDVGQAHGVVTARNSGGPVQVGSAEGVRCDSAAGGVRLANISGSMRVTTAIGSIIASLLAGKPMADSFLSTGSGDITVFIPSNVGVTIQAQNELSDSIRRIVSDFPGIRVRVEGGQVVAEGPVNGGGPILRISGTGGTIFIKRQQ